MGFNLKFLWKLVVYILNFPKSVRGVTSDEKFQHNRLSKSNFKYLVKTTISYTGGGGGGDKKSCLEVSQNIKFSCLIILRV